MAPAIDWFLANYRINRFHGGQAPTELEEYANLIGEVWHVGCREIERGRVNLGVLDPDLQAAQHPQERMERERQAARGGPPQPGPQRRAARLLVCGSRLSGAVTAREVDAAEVGRSDFAGPAVGRG